MTFIIVIDLIFVELVRLYIYTKLAESITDSTASFRSRDRYEISGNLEFNNVIGYRREYEMILSIL